MVPKAEEDFKALLEEWYVAQGVSREYPLFSHWVEATGPATYQAGERIARELSALTGLEGKLVLDVGCGFGGAVSILDRMGARCVGIDMNQEELVLCRQRLSLHGLATTVLCADAYNMPFTNESFDIVICTEVLEHVKDKNSLIAEMSRVLKKGGVLYLSFPNLLSLRNVWSDPHYHLFGVTLLPLPLARWYTRKRVGRNYDVEMLPIPPLLARVCAKKGIDVYSVNASEAVLRRKIETPNSIHNKVLRIVFTLLCAVGLRPFLKAAVRLRASITPNAILAGFKS